MANLLRYEPFSDFAALQRQFFGDDWLSPATGITIPTTDVYTDDKKLMVEAHLPKFEEKDIDIQLDNGSLIISAQRHEKDEDKTKKYISRESSTSFYRRIQLPKKTSTDDIEAHLRDGVLKVSIQLAPLPEPKKIPIKTN